MTATVDTDTLGAASDALIAGVIELIEDQRSNLAQAFAQAAAESGHKYCTLTSNRDEPCDRPPAHDGVHSWELEQTIRRYRDAEVRASKIPALENQLTTVRRKLAESDKALDAYRIPDPEDPTKTILLDPTHLSRRRRG